MTCRPSPGLTESAKPAKLWYIGLLLEALMKPKCLKEPLLNWDLIKPFSSEVISTILNWIEKLWNNKETKWGKKWIIKKLKLY